MLSLTSEEVEISSRPGNTLQVLFSGYSYKNGAEGPPGEDALWSYVFT